jgi:hypothetical protein
VIIGLEKNNELENVNIASSQSPLSPSLNGSINRDLILFLHGDGND